MVSDRQVRLLRKKRMENRTMEAAASAASMSERTARTSQRGPLSVSSRAARARIEELDAHDQGRARVDHLADDLVAFAATLRVGLDKLDFAGRQRLVRLLIERVVVTGDHVAIEHAIPLSGRFSVSRSEDRCAPLPQVHGLDAGDGHHHRAQRGQEDPRPPGPADRTVAESPGTGPDREGELRLRRGVRRAAGRGTTRNERATGRCVRGVASPTAAACVLRRRAHERPSPGVRPAGGGGAGLTVS
jgi:hypothetical protein